MYIIALAWWVGGTRRKTPALTASMRRGVTMFSKNGGCGLVLDLYGRWHVFGGWRSQREECVALSTQWMVTSVTAQSVLNLGICILDRIIACL